MSASRFAMSSNGSLSWAMTAPNTREKWNRSLPLLALWCALWSLMMRVTLSKMAAPLVDATGKPLTTEQIWAAVDWTKKESIQTTFPNYMRELLSFKKAPPKAVNIELFSMKTPFGDRYLLKDTDLVLEANKRQALFGANATGKSLLFRNMNGQRKKQQAKEKRKRSGVKQLADLNSLLPCVLPLVQRARSRTSRSTC